MRYKILKNKRKNYQNRSLPHRVP